MKRWTLWLEYQDAYFAPVRTIDVLIQANSEESAWREVYTIEHRIRLLGGHVYKAWLTERTPRTADANKE